MTPYSERSDSANVVGFRKGFWTRYRMVTSVDDIKSLRFWKAVIAEMIGTLLLVMIACGSFTAWEDPNKDHHISNAGRIIQISLCFGLGVATLVWVFGHVSGGHLNPSVTMAFFITRRISLARAVMYVIGQCVGGMIGAGLLKGVMPSNYTGNLGATTLQHGMNGGKGFGVEFFITFVLVLTVFASADKHRKDLRGSFPLSIGLAYTFCHLFAVPMTGAGMNTARSFGAAVVSGVWSSHWVYWLGPLLGGILAGLMYENLFAANASLNKAMEFLLASDYDTEKHPGKKAKIRIIHEEDIDEKEKEFCDLQSPDTPIAHVITNP
ncbi:aquaporin-5-like [Mytilus galloprovincialis]|uniref:AQP4 n=1 Tax=Mytilus edulis TaxID=6550 RepID=A0A8S3TQW7_MYTED|nr:AQP4 [Mytilus edulis]